MVFADDLFILCGAIDFSFIIIDQLLKDFHSYVGFKPNMAKCSIYYAGASEESKVTMRNILPIPEASLPVRDLGVPLISTKLKAAEQNSWVVHKRVDIWW